MTVAEKRLLHVLVDFQEKGHLPRWLSGGDVQTALDLQERGYIEADPVRRTIDMSTGDSIQVHRVTLTGRTALRNMAHEVPDVGAEALKGPFETVAVPSNFNPSWFRNNFNIDSQTGELSGTIPAGTPPGDYYATVQATDARGKKALGVMRFTVEEPEADDADVKPGADVKLGTKPEAEEQKKKSNIIKTLLHHGLAKLGWEGVQWSWTEWFN